MTHLLLLHGALGDKSQLKPLADSLNEDFKVHTLNFAGHGGASMPESFTIDRFADDVLTFMDENKIASAHIFGYSMGGYVALKLAKSHPQRVGKIFTLGTKLEWSPEVAQRETRMLDAAKIEEKVPALATQLANRHAPNDWKEVLRKTAEMMIALGNSPLNSAFYESIANDVRLAVGDRDTMTSLDETASAFRQIPNASLIVLPQTPHPIEKVDIERVKDELRLFFH